MALGRSPRIRHLPYAWRSPVPHLWSLPLYGHRPLRPVARDNPGEKVGRVEELQTLKVARGGPQPANRPSSLWRGEAGVGNRPVVGEGALPYAPVVEVLRALLSEVGAAAVRALVGPFFSASVARWLLDR